MSSRKRTLSDKEESMVASQTFGTRKGRPKSMNEEIRQRALTQVQQKSLQVGADCTDAINQINECSTRDELDNMMLEFKCQLGHDIFLKGTCFTNPNTNVNITCKSCTPIKNQIRNSIKDAVDRGIITTKPGELEALYMQIGKAGSDHLYVTYLELTLSKCSHKGSYSMGLISTLPLGDLSNLKCQHCTFTNTDTAGFKHIKDGLEYCMVNQLLQINKDEIEKELKNIAGNEIRDMERYQFVSKCSKGHPLTIYCATFRKFKGRLDDYFQGACKLCDPPLYTVYLSRNFESFKNKFKVQYLDDISRFIVTTSLAQLLPQKFSILTACGCELSLPIRGFLRNIDWSEFNWECYLHHPTATAHDICSKVQAICGMFGIDPSNESIVSTLNMIKSESINLDYIIPIKLNCNGTILLSAQTVHQTPMETISTLLLKPCSSCPASKAILDSLENFINSKSTVIQVKDSDVLEFKNSINSVESGDEYFESLFSISLPIKFIKCECLFNLNASSFYYNDYLLYNQCHQCNFKSQTIGEMGFNSAPPSIFNKMGLVQELICKSNHSILITGNKTINSVCGTCLPGSRKYEDIFSKSVTKFIQYLDPDQQYVQTRANVYSKVGQSGFYFDFQLASMSHHNKLVNITNRNGNIIYLVIEIDEKAHFTPSNQRDPKFNQLFNSNQIAQDNETYYLLRISEFYINMFPTFNEKVEKVLQCLVNTYGIILDNTEPDTRVFVSDPIYFDYFVKKDEAFQLPYTPLYSLCDVLVKTENGSDNLVADYFEKSAATNIKVSKFDGISSFISGSVANIPRFFETKGDYCAMLNNTIVIIAQDDSLFSLLNQIFKCENLKVNIQLLLVPFNFNFMAEQLLKLLHFCMSNHPNTEIFNTLCNAYRYLIKTQKILNNYSNNNNQSNN